MLHFLDGGGSAPLSLENASMQRLSLEQQPFCCLGFLSDTALIGAGFDGQVMLLTMSLAMRLPGGLMP